MATYTLSADFAMDGVLGHQPIDTVINFLFLTQAIGFTNDYDITNPAELASLQAEVEAAIQATGATSVDVELSYASSVLTIEASYDWSGSTDEGRIIALLENQIAAPFELGESACLDCYDLNLKACQDEYDIATGLDPTTAYVAVFTDRTQKEYVQDVTTDGSGDMTVSMENMPLGFATPEHSPLQFTVRETEDSADEMLTVETIRRPCIRIMFVYREDVTPAP